MGLVKRMLEDYAQAVHPDDDTKQYDLVTKLATGSIRMPTPEEMQDKIETFRRDYEQIEQWWERFWDQNGQPNWTRPWLGTTYGNGAKFYDHNPTFSCLSSCGNYAFRVLHLYEGQGVFAYWTDLFDDRVKMLTLSASMSMTLEAISVVKRWLTQGYEIEPQDEDYDPTSKDTS